MEIAGKRFRLIDLSRMIVPGANPERPFDMTEGVLGDGTTKFDVHRTHTHVGTHVEAARHFFADGPSIDQYPIGSFFGRGILLDLSLLTLPGKVTQDDAQRLVDDILRDGDVVVCRNASPGDPPRTRHFSEEALLYLKARRVKMLVLGDHVGFGETVAEGRRIHELLMREMTFLEIVDHLDQISRREFLIMALPILIQGADSSWCRAMVLEEE